MIIKIYLCFSLALAPQTRPSSTAELGEDISRHWLFFVLRLSKKEGSDGDQHQNGGNEESNGVAIRSVQALKFSQKRRNKGRKERASIDGSIKKWKETRKLLLASLVLLKLISSESADAWFDSACTNGDDKKSDESDNGVDCTGNILSTVDLRHRGNRHKYHSEEINKGDVNNSVHFAPVRIGNDSTDKREEVA